jgi:hypothetical protein
MATVDKLIVRIEADMRDLKNKLKSAERSTQQSTTKMRASFARLRTSISGATAGIFSLKGALIGLGVGAGIRSIIKTGMSIESLKIRLELLFGSVEEGSKAFEVMADFASKVPFSLGQIQQGAGALAVVTKNADELGDMLEITGNVAAATGIDFATSALQIQKAFSSGLASAEIFNDKGVRQMLGFQVGATVSIEETAKAFKREFAGDGQFAKAADRLADTFGGTLSMLGDKVFNFQRAINDEGFFEELKKQFSDLDKSLVANADSVDELARKIAQGLVAATKSLSDALVFVNNNFKLVVSTIGILIGMKLTLIIAGIGIAFVSLAKDIAIATRAMKLLNFAFNKNPLIGGVSLLLLALAEVTGGFDIIIEKIKVAISKIKEFFGLAGKALPKKTEEDDDGDGDGALKVNVPIPMPSQRQSSIEEILQRAKVRSGGAGGMFDEVTGDDERITATRKAMEERDKVIKETLQDLKILSKAEEEYKDTLVNLDLALQMGVISQDDYSLALGRAKQALFESTEEGKIALEGLERVTDFLSDSTADALTGMTDGWKGFRDGLKQIIRDIISDLLKLQAKQAAMKLLGGGGGGSSSFGFGDILSIGSSFLGSFGGGGGGASFAGPASMGSGGYGSFANGGHITRPSIVGEKGPELFVPHTSGGIFTNRSLNNMGGGGVSVNQTINIETGVSQTVRAEILSLLPQIKSETIGAVIDSKKRGGQMAETFS